MNETTFDDWMTLDNFPDVTAAGMASAILEGAGIETFIPDQGAGSLGNITYAIGGIRLQVRSSHLAESKQLLAASAIADDATSDTEDDGAADPAESDADAQARRAHKIAVVSLLLLFLLPPYALTQAVQAVRAKGLSADGKKRARRALLLSSASAALLLTLILAFTRSRGEPTLQSVEHEALEYSRGVFLVTARNGDVPDLHTRLVEGNEVADMQLDGDAVDVWFVSSASERLRQYRSTHRDMRWAVFIGKHYATSAQVTHDGDERMTIIVSGDTYEARQTHAIAILQAFKNSR